MKGSAKVINGRSNAGKPEQTTTFGIIAEIHLATESTPPVAWHNPLRLDASERLLEQAVQRLSAEDVDYLVLLGDLSNSADAESLAVVRDIATSVGLPVLVVPGNHDIDRHPDARERFISNIAAESISTAPSSVEVTPGLGVTLVEIQRDAETGALLSSQFDLPQPAENELQVVFSHFPLLPMSDQLDDAELKYAGDLQDIEQLTSQLIERVAPSLAVHGHLHVRASNIQGSMLHLSCAALVEPPHEVTVIRVSDVGEGTFRVERRAISVEPSDGARLPVLAPFEEAFTLANGHWQPAS